MTSDRPTGLLTPDAEHPVTLALLRIVVCALVLASPEVRNAQLHAAFPDALRIAPEGLGWFVAHVPIGPRLAQLAELGVALGAFAGLVGYRSQLALGMVAFFGFYVFGLAQLGGAVVHDMHLVWLAAVLAASPCGDALSAFGGAARPRAVAYAWPLVMVRALFAAIYFFPGLWKLRESGLAWALSDNLRNQMYAKWFEYGGLTPVMHVDEHPLLLRGAALGVLAFELGFPCLMLTRRTRLLAAIAGLAFHLSGLAFLRISFPSLWLCYVALVDWGPLADRLARRRGPRDVVVAPPAASISRWPRLVGGVLLAGAVVQGLRGAMFAWPFACYPTFQYRAGTEMPDVQLEAEFPDGHVTLLDSGGQGRGRTQEGWATVWAIGGFSHGAPSRAALVAYWNARELERARGASIGRVLRVKWSVLPADKDRAPLGRELLATFAIDPGSGQIR